MTQTTAGRITEIIREHLKFYAGSGEWAAAVEAGQEIAAEIDALTRERDEARAELAGLDAGMRFQFDRAEDYKAQRDEARAEVTRRMSDIDAARNTIVELESDRNGAQAFLDEVAFILKVPPAYMGGVNGWAEVKMCELAEARAEVERLRPAAEAWEASETLRALLRAPGRVNAEAEEEHRQELHAADRVFQAAANRARAAKESQP